MQAPIVKVYKHAEKDHTTLMLGLHLGERLKIWQDPQGSSTVFVRFFFPYTRDLRIFLHYSLTLYIDKKIFHNKKIENKRTPLMEVSVISEIRTRGP